MKLLSSKPSLLIGREAGAHIIMGPISVFLFLVLMGFAIDTGNLFVHQVRLQRALDAGAISAGIYLDDPAVDDAQTATIARQIAIDNLNQLGLTFNPANINAAVNGTSVRTTGIVDVDTMLLDALPEDLLPDFQDVSGAATTAIDPGAVAIALIIDRTDSMNDPVGPVSTLGCNEYKFIDGTCSKIDLLKDAIPAFFTGFQPGRDYLTIISYADNATVDFPINNQFNASDLADDIQALDADGNTNIHEAMKFANQQLDLAPSHLMKQVILLSDGLPNKSDAWESGMDGQGTPLDGSCDAESYSTPVMQAITRAYIRAMLEADLLRQRGGRLFSIGFDPNHMSTHICGANEHPLVCDPKTSNNFMRRMANDGWGGLPLFPYECANTLYSDYNSSSTPPPSQGKYIHTPNAIQISQVLQNILDQIKPPIPRLTE